MELSDNPGNDEKERDMMIFDLIKRRYDSELQTINDLDSKAGNLIGFVSVTIGLLVGVGTLNLIDKLSKFEYFIIYILGIVILLVSIIFSMYAIKIRKWAIAPEVQYLRFKYYSQPLRTVIRANAAVMAEAIKTIEKQNGSKAILINYSWYLLIAGLSMVLIFVIVFTTTS